MQRYVLTGVALALALSAGLVAYRALATDAKISTLSTGETRSFDPQVSDALRASAAGGQILIEVADWNENPRMPFVVEVYRGDGSDGSELLTVLNGFSVIPGAKNVFAVPVSGEQLRQAAAGTFPITLKVNPISKGNPAAGDIGAVSIDAISVAPLGS